MSKTRPGHPTAQSSPACVPHYSLSQLCLSHGLSQWMNCR